LIAGAHPERPASRSRISCYASTPIAPDLLAALRSGKQLKVSFQNLGKETITIPIPLADFAAAYDKIK
jgi:invasion protein IalB